MTAVRKVLGMVEAALTWDWETKNEILSRVESDFRIPPDFLDLAVLDGAAERATMKGIDWYRRKVRMTK